MTINGKPYAPERFQEIIEERYQISKRIHTSYNELGEVTPREREMLLKLIARDIVHDNDVMKNLLNTK